VIFALGYFIGFKIKLINLRIPGYFVTFAASFVAVTWAIGYNNFLTSYIVGSGEANIS